MESRPWSSACTAQRIALTNNITTMQGMNTKEVLLAVGTGVMGYAMTLLKEDVVVAVGLIAVGCAVFFFRGWLKDQ